MGWWWWLASDCTQVSPNVCPSSSLSFQSSQFEVLSGIQVTHLVPRNPTPNLKPSTYALTTPTGLPSALCQSQWHLPQRRDLCAHLFDWSICWSFIDVSRKSLWWWLKDGERTWRRVSRKCQTLEEIWKRSLLLAVLKLRSSQVELSEIDVEWIWWGERWKWKRENRMGGESEVWRREVSTFDKKGREDFTAGQQSGEGRSTQTPIPVDWIVKS